jgi:hypothetical protein
MSEPESKRWGPWRLPLDHPERVPQFRSLAALARVFQFSRADLVAALRQAETDDDAADRAFQILNEVPTVPRRRIVATFGALTYG